MAKDKAGHGSNKSAEHGPYGKGSHFHGIDHAVMAEAEHRFGSEKLKKLDAYAHRQKAISVARSGSSGAPPIEKGRPR